MMDGWNSYTVTVPERCVITPASAGAAAATASRFVRYFSTKMEKNDEFS